MLLCLAQGRCTENILSNPLLSCTAPLLVCSSQSHGYQSHQYIPCKLSGWPIYQKGKTCVTPDFALHSSAVSAAAVQLFRVMNTMLNIGEGAGCASCSFSSARKSLACQLEEAPTPALLQHLHSFAVVLLGRYSSRVLFRKSLDREKTHLVGVSCIELVAGDICVVLDALECDDLIKMIRLIFQHNSPCQCTWKAQSRTS